MLGSIVVGPFDSRTGEDGEKKQKRASGVPYEFRLSSDSTFGQTHTLSCELSTNANQTHPEQHWKGFFFIR